jgi:phage recombination protein Bet
MSETPAIYNAQSIQVFTSEERALIASQIAPGFSDSEVALFVAIAQKSGLDPFGPEPEIWAVPRNQKQPNGQYIKKMVIQVSMAGLRKRAQNTGLYGGQLGPYWCNEKGEWSDIWLGSGNPTAAKVGVIRLDWKEPLWAIAKWSSYAQYRDSKPDRMWGTAGDLMIALAAERLALRKAFPHETRSMSVVGETTQETQAVEGVIITDDPPVMPSLSDNSRKSLAAATGFSEEVIEAVEGQYAEVIEPQPIAEQAPAPAEPPPARSWPSYIKVDAVPIRQPTRQEQDAGEKPRPFTRQEISAFIANREAQCEKIGLKAGDGYPVPNDDATDLELVWHLAQIKAIIDGAGK